MQSIRSKNVLFLPAFLLMSIQCGAMELAPYQNEKPADSATFLISVDKPSFDSLESEERWERYNRLHSEIKKQDIIIAQLKAMNTEAQKSIKDKDARIKSLSKTQEERNWKTIGITFLSTVGGLAVLGKVIDRK